MQKDNTLVLFPHDEIFFTGVVFLLYLQIYMPILSIIIYCFIPILSI
jgi:hypothetical protein